MDIKLLMEEIESSNKIIKKEQKYISNAQQEIANYHCPFKENDTVVDSSGVRMVVDKIRYKYYGKGYSIKAFKIKKDGSLYKESHHVYVDVVLEQT